MYELIFPTAEHDAGTILFDVTFMFQSLADDEERLTGIPHKVVSKWFDSKCFTVPTGYLKEVE